MKRRSIKWLLGSWAMYWAALFALQLGPALVAIWRATRSPTANDNSVSLNMGDWVFSLSVAERGAVTWSGSAHVGTLVAWIAVVPLAIWVAWLMSTRAKQRVRQAV